VPGALLTDLYELNMAASCLRHNMRALATFSLFVRNLPPSRGFLVAAGAEACCDWLEQFGFEPDDLVYLASLGFDGAALEALWRLSFTGEVLAVPEGRIVLANEPILEVTAPIAEAQLVETFLLNTVSTETMLASKGARCRIAAEGKIELVEFVTSSIRSRPRQRSRRHWPISVAKCRQRRVDEPAWMRTPTAVATNSNEAGAGLSFASLYRCGFVRVAVRISKVRVVNAAGNLERDVPIAAGSETAGTDRSC
jgi:hypothetical protein